MTGLLGPFTKPPAPWGNNKAISDDLKSYSQLRFVLYKHSAVVYLLTMETNTSQNQIETTTSAKPVKLSKRGGEFDLPTGYITAYPTVGKFSSTFSSVTSNGLGTDYEGNQTLTNGIQVEIKLTDWDSANGDVQQIDGKEIRLEVDASSLRQYITAFLNDPGQINFQLGDLEEIVAEYKNR